MKILAQRLVFASLILVFAAPHAAAQALPRTDPAAVDLSSERLGRLSDIFQRYVDTEQLAGVVVLVARRGQVAYLEAFGQRDREAGAPMQEDAIFRIASQTKALVSVGVMILQEEGKLLISDPVGRYLPEFKKTKVAVPNSGGRYDVVDAKRPITIRDLLTHTAGISYGNGPAEDRWAEAGIQGWYFADRTEPIRDTVAQIASLPFDAQPGEQWIYGYNTDILGALIEQVSGKSLEVFLQDALFDPLDMRDTHFYLPRAKKDRLTVVYSSTPAGSIERAPDPGHMVGQGAYLDGPRTSFSGGAGLLSTARDYARFLQMMLNGGALDGNRILSRKTVELMTVDHVGDLDFRVGQGFGLGFSVVTDLGARGTLGSHGEYGWGGAYHSTYWVDPKEELIVVYFTQLRPALDINDQDTLRALVYQAVVD